jgi:hypothetical protein
VTDNPMAQKAAALRAALASERGQEQVRQQQQQIDRAKNRKLAKIAKDLDLTPEQAAKLPEVIDRHGLTPLVW